MTGLQAPRTPPGRPSCRAYAAGERATGPVPCRPRASASTGQLPGRRCGPGQVSFLRLSQPRNPTPLPADTWLSQTSCRNTVSGGRTAPPRRTKRKRQPISEPLAGRPAWTCRALRLAASLSVPVRIDLHEFAAGQSARTLGKDRCIACKRLTLRISCRVP